MLFLALGFAALGVVGIVSAAGSRYECESGDVEKAAEEFNEINNSIEDIHDSIQNQINIINNNVQGFEEYLQSVNENGVVVQESVTSLMQILNEEAELIAEYESANFLKKLGATYAMIGTNLFEGAVSVIEDIGDAIILVGATVCSPFTDTKSWQVFAARDLTGEAFDYLYDDGFLKGIETYSGFSHESTMANVFKGIGTAIPYVILAASGIGLAGEAIVAGTTGLGRGSSDYMSQHLMYDENGKLTFDENYSLGTAWLEGGKEGIKDAALTVVMDKGFSKLGELKHAKVKADALAKTANEQLISKYGKNMDDLSTDLLEGLRNKTGTEMSEDALKKEVDSLVSKAKAGNLTSKEMQKINDLLPETKKITAEEVETALNQKLVTQEQQRIVKNGSKSEIREIDQAGKDAIKELGEEAGTSSVKTEAVKTDAEIRKMKDLAAEKSVDNATTKELKKITQDTKKAIKSPSSTTTTAFTPESELKISKEWSADNYQQAAMELGNKNRAVKDFREAEVLDSKALTGNRLTNPGQSVDTSAMEKLNEARANIKSAYGNQTKIIDTKAAKLSARDATVAKIKDSNLGQTYAKVEDGVSKLKTTIKNSTPVQKINQVTQDVMNSKPAQGIGKAADNMANLADKIITKLPTVSTGAATTVLATTKLNTPEYIAPYDKTSMTGINGNEYVPDNSMIGIDAVDDITIPSTPPEQTNGGDYYNGTYTPSSPELKPITGNTTTPGQNSDSSTTEKTPEKTTDNEQNNNPSKNPDDANKSTTDDNKTPDDNKTTDPTPTPSKDENTVVSNPPSSNNNQSTSGVNHGGTTTNNNSGNNNWNSNSKTDSNNETNSELEPELEPELPIEDSDLIEDPNEEESVYTIPSNLSGVSETKKSSSGSGVLPVLGGLGAAAAVGVGAKMYLDNKKNNENGEDEDSDGEFDEYSNDEFTDSAENNDLLADEWNGEDTEFNYENPSGSSIVEPDDDDLGEI